MTDLIIVTAFRRPEMLYLALEHLSRCREVNECDLVIWIDRHEAEFPNPGIERAIEMATPLFHQGYLRSYHFPPHANDGMTRMTMEILKAYAQLDRFRYVLLLEEDIMVSADWIRWTRAALEKFDPFCTYGTMGTWHDPNNTPEQVSTMQFFSAWGAGWKREKLKKLIPYATEDYYRDIYGFCGRYFPEEIKTHNVCSWDGLISNLMKKDNLWGVYPLVPRCFHAGFYGHYRRRDSRLDSREGTLEEKIRELRVRFKDSAWMTEDYPDCLPSNVEDKNWQDLQMAS